MREFRSQDVQALGTLYFQRKLKRDRQITFIAKGTCLALQPDDVITLNHSNYGGSYDVKIDQMHIYPDLQIGFKCVKYSVALDDFGDLAPSSVSVATDDSTVVWQGIAQGPASSPTSGVGPSSLADSLVVSGENHIFNLIPNEDDDITFKSPETKIINETPLYLPFEDTVDLEVAIEENKQIDGFRIQLLSTKDLENATRAKAIAMEQFTDIRVKFYLEFDSPYYKVRLGDFRTREETEEVREIVRSMGYPKAWIVKSKIWSNSNELFKFFSR